jgi:hypothetical protein
MTPEANRRLPTAAEATAARQVMLIAAEILARFLPSDASGELRRQTLEAVERRLSARRSTLEGMTFPDMTAVESDMWEQEDLEAFDRLSVEFMRRVSGEAG